MGKITDEIGSQSQHSAELIQEDIRHTESEMSDTINTIEERLSPEHLKKEFTSRFKSTLTDYRQRLETTIRTHPLPLALIGAGIVFLSVKAMQSKKGKVLKEEGLSISPRSRLAQEEPVEEPVRPHRQAEDYLTAAFVGIAAGAALALLPEYFQKEEKSAPVIYGQYGTVKEEAHEEPGPLIK